MPQTQHPAAAFLFVLFLIWLIFPEGEYQGQSLALSDLVTERLERYHDALDALNQTRWGDFAPQQLVEEGGHAGDAKYVNLTGFREEDGFAWEDLGRFRDRGLQLSRHAIPPVGGQWLWEVAEGEPLWVNTSGTLLGEWVRRPGSVARTYDSYNLSKSVPSMDWIGHHTDWARNMTGDTGRILLRLEGNKTVAHHEQLPVDQSPLSGGLIRNVKGVVTIEDTKGSGLNWDMRLWGVHWPRQGVVILTTTSEKFEGIFGLPHLTPGPDFFQSSQWLLNQTLARVISEKEKNVFVDQSMPWNSDMDSPIYTANPTPHCEFILYAQIHPPTWPNSKPRSKGETMIDVINSIESELESPQGVPIRVIPKLQMSTVLYSPDCAFFLESKGPPEFPPGEGRHLVGMKTEVHIYEIKTWLLVYAVVVFGQVYLLKNQMKETFTPSTLGRVSFGTTSIMVIVDGMTFTAAATWVSSAAATFLPTLALMFAAFLSMTIGGSFLAKIHEVQTPTRSHRQGGQDAGTANSGSTSLTSSAPLTPDRTGTGPLLPAPVTAGRGAPLPPVTEQTANSGIADGASAVPGSTITAAGRPPAAPPPPQTQTFQSIIGRFILLSLCISFLAISSSTWYANVRGYFMNLCAFAYLSLWVPQIYRNVIRNCRRALKWQFVIGQSVLRLLPLAYFWVKPDNFAYARTDRRAFAVLVVWVWLQILVLATQDAVGPRFGIPAGWTPDAWDYHPVLREDNIEAGGLPIGLGEESPSTERGRSSEDKGRGGGLRAIDCAICRELLEVPVVRAGGDDTNVASVFTRRMYMVTPCRHIFHTACLEGWMRFRLQCPICREELPPL
ncbi:DSC E3 ubiquitin ligase complex subunit 1-like protein [Cladobotryum mycophilum]|uniref:RING-type E3 ubiquitin transferase n=1 Tax=Cladobotryum mycophilum TaxID=491253 RepID=A0ABR0SMH4_9HYPO